MFLLNLNTLYQTIINEIINYHFLSFRAPREEYPIIYFCCFMAVIMGALFIKTFLTLCREEIANNKELRSKMLNKLIVTGIATSIFSSLFLILGFIGGASK